MKLLIVEDEEPLLNNMLGYLTGEQFISEGVTTYVAALERIHLYEYDCLLLDITLPDGNGLRLLEAYKQLRKKAGIIIISAKNSLDDRIAGLDLGADDYLTKPFHLSELNARIKAVIRRKAFNTHDFIDAGNVRVDMTQRRVWVDQQAITLTRKELDILLHLLANQERVVTKTSLAEHLWGDHIDQADSFNFLFAHIKNLKKKLLEAGATPEIRNIYGVGYQLLVNA
ncbi:response regulator transcription factor [Larkinella punicea]|uniref:DNA-binding response regulator n=1 Tax=Larkinella punicea TaxID=2315727 RepID=A0A368JII0_9BACT|nr:response regulator transcription factor [Larkinella punicea]RCR67468.1 DNA-binding response regulator [Larkinella punicea]